jgi:oligogalacturonide lyase
MERAEARCYYSDMPDLVRGPTRRDLIFLAAAPLAAQSRKATQFPSDWRRYADPSTEFEVHRLTDPAYTSLLPAHYNRSVARRSAFLLFSCDRSGSPQVFRMDLKGGATEQVTDVEGLDPASLALLPDSRSACYFAGRTLHLATIAGGRDRELYTVPPGWERCEGLSVRGDGGAALFGEQRDGVSRLRTVALPRGTPGTILEGRFEVQHPLFRPVRAQVLYRQGDSGLSLVNTDGQQNRALKVAPGKIGPANWAPNGRTILYLRFPEDRTQLNEIREHTPDSNTDALVAKTSQFVHLGFNADTSVFVGASRNAASPTLLLLLRITRRELTLCEHKSSQPETVAPFFSPDSQTIFFQSDRHGKPAIYSIRVDKLVEKIEAET